MNEITRIHIAKVPYDIEIIAKKEIEKYIKALELYANDDELLQDIEIRITELLAERGVVTNGVITVSDVASIREQLGEPKDFRDDNNSESDQNIEESGVIHKLYRNIDEAILGGVLSGISSYFSINALWVRLIFVVLFMISAGTVSLAYLLLWIIMPPARTATEKLQMVGKPVTLMSIRTLNEDELRTTTDYDRSNNVRRVIMSLVGCFLLAISLSVLIFTIFAAFNVYHADVSRFVQSSAKWIYVGAYLLAIIAGLLLSALFAVGAYTVFSRKFTKRLVIGVVIIIITGLASFGTAFGLVSYQSWQLNDQTSRNIVSSNIIVPVNFSNISDLTINAELANVDYIVDNNPRIVMSSSDNIKKPVISIDNKKATINLTSSQKDHWSPIQSTLTIYGPKLDKLIVQRGYVSYSTNSQNMSIETTGQDSSVNLQSGTFSELDVVSGDQSLVDASGVTVEVAKADTKTGARVNFGIVKSLYVTQPDACPVDADTTIVVRSINTDTIQYNGTNISAKVTHKTSCGSVLIGGNN
jgi:phage shock protein PspC (stress-responsive transcriptional regulator)